MTFRYKADKFIKKYRFNPLPRVSLKTVIHSFYKNTGHGKATHINERVQHMKLTDLAATIFLLVMAVMLTACTTVQPWERGNLAKPQMALDSYPLQSALRAHNYGSREAAAGGNAAQGGGCGCY
jgi:Domain of unknown function (DUF4266)